jgi:hypothetical protein
MSKEKVVVSRKWKNPEITVFVSSEEIGAKMDIEAYLDTLVQQVASIPLTMTKEQLARKLKDAHVLVVEEMKSSTQYIV